MWENVSGDGESASVGIWSDDVSDCGTCMNVCVCVRVCTCVCACVCACVFRNVSLQVNLLLNLKANVAVLQGKCCRIYIRNYF